MPTISIIVPVYNVEKFLPTCIQSILEQTFTDFELILVDDGSSDKCPAICEEYAEKDFRIKVIHKENGGLSDARNTGLKASKGKFIGFVDSDDFIRKDMYEILLRELEKSNADFVKSNFIFYSEGDEYSVETKEFSVNVYNSLEAINDFFKTEYSNRKPMKSTVCDALYKREMFFDEDKLTICFPVGKINEDTYIFPELIFRASKIIHIDEAYYFYRMREESIMHSSISLREIMSCDLWKHIGNIVSQYTDAYINDCEINSVRRYLNVLERTYFSIYRKAYFRKVRKTLLVDTAQCLQYVKDIRVRRTLKLIRCYPLYLCIRKLVRNKIY